MGEFDCEKCGKSFSSEQALEQHKQDYDHSKLKECSKCGEKFRSKEKYSEHKKTHWGPVRRHLFADHYVIGGIALIGLVIALGLGLNALPSDGSSQESLPEDVGQTVSITGGDFYFNPSTSRINDTGKVRVRFTNQGGVSHNLRLTGIGKGTSVIRPGQSEAFTFNASKDGETPIEFECTLPGHAERGMVGRFTST
ncbi:MAG: C2H2-type zinc finger protein [Candidatus Halalkalibacterium sp. M3_1C_030]